MEAAQAEPRAPRRMNDPIPPACCPVLGGARLTPVDARQGRHPLRGLYAKRLAPGPGGQGRTPGGLVPSPAVRPPAGRAGAPCGDRPASGPAGPKPGLARTGSKYEEERKRRRPGPATREIDEKE